MAIFNSYVSLSEGKPPFSYGFSYGFPIKTSIFPREIPQWHDQWGLEPLRASHGFDTGAGSVATGPGMADPVGRCGEGGALDTYKLYTHTHIYIYIFLYIYIYLYIFNYSYIHIFNLDLYFNIYVYVYMYNIPI